MYTKNIETAVGTNIVLDNELIEIDNSVMAVEKYFRLDFLLKKLLSVTLSYLVFFFLF